MVINFIYIIESEKSSKRIKTDPVDNLNQYNEKNFELNLVGSTLMQPADDIVRRKSAVFKASRNKSNLKEGELALEKSLEELKQKVPESEYQNNRVNKSQAFQNEYKNKTSTKSSFHSTFKYLFNTPREINTVRKNPIQSSKYSELNNISLSDFRIGNVVNVNLLKDVVRNKQKDVDREQNVVSRLIEKKRNIKTDANFKEQELLYNVFNKGSEFGGINKKNEDNEKGSVFWKEDNEYESYNNSFKNISDRHFPDPRFSNLVYSRHKKIENDWTKFEHKSYNKKSLRKFISTKDILIKSLNGNQNKKPAKVEKLNIEYSVNLIGSKPDLLSPQDYKGTAVQSKQPTAREHDETKLLNMNEYHQSKQPTMNTHYQSKQPTVNEHHQSKQPMTNEHHQSKQPTVNEHYQSKQQTAKEHYQSKQPTANENYQSKSMTMKEQLKALEINDDGDNNYFSKYLNKSKTAVNPLMQALYSCILSKDLSPKKPDTKRKNFFSMLTDGNDIFGKSHILSGEFSDGPNKDNMSQSDSLYLNEGDEMNLELGGTTLARKKKSKPKKKAKVINPFQNIIDPTKSNVIDPTKSNVTDPTKSNVTDPTKSKNVFEKSFSKNMSGIALDIKKRPECESKNCLLHTNKKEIVNRQIYSKGTYMRPCDN